MIRPMAQPAGPASHAPPTMALQVLSRAVVPRRRPLGKIAGNPCEGIKQLYSNDRSEIIWTDSDMAQLKKTCSAEIANAVDLAATAACGSAIWCGSPGRTSAPMRSCITTGKSKHRREAIIPLYDALRDVLARIPKRVDHNPDQQPSPTLDRGRIRQLIQQGQDRRRHGGPRSAFPRPARNCGDAILHRRFQRCA